MQLKEVEVILQQHEDTLQQHDDAAPAAAAPAAAAAAAATDLLGRSAAAAPSRPTFSVGGAPSPPRGGDGSESFGALNAAQLVRHAGLEPQTSRQGPRQVCYSHVRALPRTGAAEPVATLPRTLGSDARTARERGK